MPRSLGYVVGVYALALFLLPNSLDELTGWFYMFALPGFTLLPTVCVVMYVIGGVGLALRRRWASMVVIVTAGVQVALLIYGTVIQHYVGSSFWSSLMSAGSLFKVVVAFLPPLPLAYWAIVVRRNLGL